MVRIRVRVRIRIRVRVSVRVMIRVGLGLGLGLGSSISELKIDLRAQNLFQSSKPISELGFFSPAAPTGHSHA